MDDAAPAYRISVRGHVALDWSDWFDGLRVRHEPDGTSTLEGFLPDQAALHGVLGRVRDLALPLLALERRSPDPDPARMCDAPLSPLSSVTV